jgi:hypothetical protein
MKAAGATHLPRIVKIAIGTVMVGGALLTVSIVRERWHLSQRERYQSEAE